MNSYQKIREIFVTVLLFTAVTAYAVGAGFSGNTLSGVYIDTTSLAIGIGSTTPYASFGIKGTTAQQQPLLVIASSTDLLYFGINASGTPIMMTSNASHGNLSFGTTTLAAGVSTVSTKVVQSDSMIMLHYCGTKTPVETTATNLSVKTKTVGTSFVASSTSVADTSVICWQVMNPVY